MNKIHKIFAVGMLGLMLGSSVSVFTAAPAGARASMYCNNRIDKMETTADRDLAKGRIDQATYDKLQQEIAYHRTLWGC